MKLPASRLALLAVLLGVFPLSGCSTMHVEEAGTFVKRTILVTGAPRTYQVFVPARRSANQPVPVVLFLHGSGERGSDGESQTRVGLGPYVRAHAKDFPALVVFPQVEQDGEWRGANVDMALAATEAASREFGGDPGRTYLTGLSMGGYGTWEIAPKAPHRFAALVPICGALLAPNDMRALYVTEVVNSPDPHAAVASRLGHLPVWIFHGARDETVPPADDRKTFAAFKAIGGKVQYTEFPEAGHNSWDATYQHAPLWAWLFAQQKH